MSPQRRHRAGRQLRPDPHFVEYASAEQKKRFLSDLLGGRKIMSLGMTEPDAGSAVTELRPSATSEGDGLSHRRRKIFSTHSPEAALFLVYVRFGPGVGGIGSVLIERGTPGFTIGKPSTLHERRGVVAALLRQLHGPRATCCSAPAASRSRSPGSTSSAWATHRARSRSGAMLQRRARAALDAQTVRPPAVRVPGPAVEVRRDGGEARCGATAALPRGGEGGDGCPSRTRPRRPSWPATSPAWKSQRGAAGHGRHGLQPGIDRGVLRAARAAG